MGIEKGGIIVLATKVSAIHTVQAGGGRPRKGAHSQKDQAERGAPGSLQERYRAPALYSIIPSKPLPSTYLPFTF